MGPASAQPACDRPCDRGRLHFAAVPTPARSILCACEFRGVRGIAQRRAPERLADEPPRTRRPACRDSRQNRRCAGAIDPGRPFTSFGECGNSVRSGTKLPSNGSHVCRAASIRDEYDHDHGNEGQVQGQKNQGGIEQACHCLTSSAICAPSLAHDAG